MDAPPPIEDSNTNQPPSLLNHSKPDPPDTEKKASKDLGKDIVDLTSDNESNAMLAHGIVRDITADKKK